MDKHSPAKVATLADACRVEQPKDRQIVLVLQGGGALGSFQSGIYERLDELGVDVTWVAGISIGAVNAAIIAGNPPGRRAERLRFGSHEGEASAARHAQLIELCAAGDADAAARLTEQIWQTLTADLPSSTVEQDTA